MAKRKLIGQITSDKMDKTVSVMIERIKENKKYRKKYKVHKKYKAHDEKNEYKTGEMVEIQETSPISKEKKWEVIRKINPKLPKKA